MPQESQEEEAFAAAVAAFVAVAVHRSSCPCHRREKAAFDHDGRHIEHIEQQCGREREPRESEAAAFVAALAAADQHRRNIRRPSSSEEEGDHQRHLHLHLHLHLQRAGRC